MSSNNIFESARSYIFDVTSGRVAGSALIHAFSRLLALVSGVVLGRSLGAEGYGVYSYALAVMSLLSVLAHAGIPSLLLRDISVGAAEQQWSNVREDIYRGVVTVGALAVLISCVGFVVLNSFGNQLAGQMRATFSWVLILLPLVALITVAGHVLRGLNEVLIGQAVEYLGRSLVFLLLIAVSFYFLEVFQSPKVAIIAQVIAATVTLLLGGWKLKKIMATWVHVPRTQRERPWIVGMLPFTLISIAAVINSQVDILMLGWFRSVQDVGIYRVAIQGSTLVAFSLQIANMIVAPRIAALYAAGEIARLQRLVTRSAQVVLIVAFPVALVFVLIGGSLAAWIFGDEFISTRVPLAILAIGYLFNAVFGSVGVLLNMTGHEKDTARVMWQTTGVNVVLNAILIPYFGTVGAATATALSVLIWNIVLFRMVRRRLNINASAFGMLKSA